MASLNQPYKTENEAVKAIATSLDAFYRTNYGEVYRQKADAVQGAISETQRIYQTYFFPEMKTNWETHPNNIGHLYSSGCFRCHDGEHVSNTGKVISNDCNICHTVLSDSARPSSVLKTLSVQHPVDLGGLADRKCETCHKANEPFKHPVNLGDISSFQSVECHPRKEIRQLSIKQLSRRIAPKTFPAVSKKHNQSSARANRYRHDLALTNRHDQLAKQSF